MKQKFTFSKLILFVAVLCLTVNNLDAQTLEAHYKFDNSLLDETANDWDLTAFDTDTSLGFETGHDGTTNGAISGFDLSDYLTTTTNFSISGDASRTMTAWIKLISNTPQTSVVGGGTNTTGAKWTFGHQGFGVRAEINGKGTGKGTLTLNAWHHIAVVWDKDNDLISIYLDGVLAGTATGWAVSLNTAVGPLFVGNDFNGVTGGVLTPNRGFNGAIDDVQIYSGAADDAFISTIFNSTTVVLSTNNNKLETAFNTYPNPVQDRLYFSTNKVTFVEIYNLLGAKIASQNVNKGIDVSTLSKGIYLVKGQDIEGVNIMTTKVIKE